MITDQTKLRARALADCAPELVAAAPAMFAALQAIARETHGPDRPIHTNYMHMAAEALKAARGEA
jgi:hypothetical protein